VSRRRPTARTCQTGRTSSSRTALRWVAVAVASRWQRPPQLSVLTVWSGRILRASERLQAKYFTETRLLQQDVKVILEGQNNKTLVSTVLHPNGNIAEALVRDGLAKVVDWSITLVTGGPARLRDLEKCVSLSGLCCGARRTVL